MRLNKEVVIYDIPSRTSKTTLRRTTEEGGTRALLDDFQYFLDGKGDFQQYFSWKDGERNFSTGTELMASSPGVGEGDPNVLRVVDPFWRCPWIVISNIYFPIEDRLNVWIIRKARYSWNSFFCQSTLVIYSAPLGLGRAPIIARHPGDPSVELDNSKLGGLQYEKKWN